MKACGITDVGLQRHENQDTFAVERGAADGQLIAVVCDGMGGENCGQIASSLAVRAFLDELHAVLRADMTTGSCAKRCRSAFPKQTLPSNATRRSIRSVTAWGRRSSPP